MVLISGACVRGLRLDVRLGSSYLHAWPLMKSNYVMKQHCNMTHHIYQPIYSPHLPVATKLTINHTTSDLCAFIGKLVLIEKSERLTFKILLITEYFVRLRP